MQYSAQSDIHANNVISRFDEIQKNSRTENRKSNIFRKVHTPLEREQKTKKSVTIGDACPASVCTCIPHAATK